MTAAERRSLVAGGLGWMLDAMDVMLYSLVLPTSCGTSGWTRRTAGLLNSLTLLASAHRRAAASASWPTASAARAR